MNKCPKCGGRVYSDPQDGYDECANNCGWSEWAATHSNPCRPIPRPEEPVCETCGGTGIKHPTEEAKQLAGNGVLTSYPCPSCKGTGIEPSQPEKPTEQTEFIEEVRKTYSNIDARKGFHPSLYAMQEDLLYCCDIVEQLTAERDSLQKEIVKMNDKCVAIRRKLEAERERLLKEVERLKTALKALLHSYIMTGKSKQNRIDKTEQALKGQER